jgi:hypothetical protein
MTRYPSVNEEEGYMIIFLRNIPINTRKYEIAAFIEPIFYDSFLGKSAIKVSVQDIAILSLKDVDSETLEKHALVRIIPAAVARRMIKRLNGVLFKNSLIWAREYINRSTLNDPRNSTGMKSIGLLDRRVADRRRRPVMNSWQKDPILVHSVSA